MLRTNNRGVAAAFARQEAATNSNNQFFSPDGRVLYSYGAHWPLAVWKDGKVYVNDVRYSSTTSKHRGFAIGGLIREGVIDKHVPVESLERMKDLANR